MKKFESYEKFDRFIKENGLMEPVCKDIRIGSFYYHKVNCVKYLVTRKEAPEPFATYKYFGECVCEATGDKIEDCELGFSYRLIPCDSNGNIYIEDDIKPTEQIIMESIVNDIIPEDKQEPMWIEKTNTHIIFKNIDIFWEFCQKQGIYIFGNIFLQETWTVGDYVYLKSERDTLFKLTELKQDGTWIGDGIKGHKEGVKHLGLGSKENFVKANRDGAVLVRYSYIALPNMFDWEEVIERIELDKGDIKVEVPMKKIEINNEALKELFSGREICVYMPMGKPIKTYKIFKNSLLVKETPDSEWEVSGASLNFFLDMDEDMWYNNTTLEKPTVEQKILKKEVISSGRLQVVGRCDESSYEIFNNLESYLETFKNSDLPYPHEINIWDDAFYSKYMQGEGFVYDLDYLPEVDGLENSKIFKIMDRSLYSSEFEYTGTDIINESEFRYFGPASRMVPCDALGKIRVQLKYCPPLKK